MAFSKYSRLETLQAAKKASKSAIEVLAIMALGEEFDSVTFATSSWSYNQEKQSSDPHPSLKTG